MRTAVLISGKGTNLEAILKAEREQRIGEAQVTLVISNKSDALGLNIAQEYHKKIEVISMNNHGNMSGGESRLLDLLEQNKIELIVLAGFMRVLSSNFISNYKNKIINIHPSILPSFPGLEAQKQALDYGVKISGCTVHFVNEEVDGGPIILQKQVKVHDEDTVEKLSERILMEEHRLLPKAISLFSLGKMEVRGRSVRIVK